MAENDIHGAPRSMVIDTNSLNYTTTAFRKGYHSTRLFIKSLVTEFSGYK